MGVEYCVYCGRYVLDVFIAGPCTIAVESDVFVYKKRVHFSIHSILTHFCKSSILTQKGTKI